MVNFQTDGRLPSIIDDRGRDLVELSNELTYTHLSHHKDKDNPWHHRSLQSKSEDIRPNRTRNNQPQPRPQIINSNQKEQRHTRSARFLEGVIRNAEEILEVWFAIRETFEDGTQGDGNVQDGHELGVVLGEADVGRDGRKQRVDEVYHGRGMLVEGDGEGMRDLIVRVSLMVLGGRMMKVDHNRRP